MEKLTDFERFVLAKDIAARSLSVLEDFGQNVCVNNQSGLVRLAVLGPIGLCLKTPFSSFPNSPRNYGVEVWTSKKSKVFSYWWDPPVLVSFIYGPWISCLLDYSIQSEEGEIK